MSGFFILILIYNLDNRNLYILKTVLLREAVQLTLPSWIKSYQTQ